MNAPREAGRKRAEHSCQGVAQSGERRASMAASQRTTGGGRGALRQPQAPPNQYVSYIGAVADTMEDVVNAQSASCSEAALPPLAERRPLASLLRITATLTTAHGGRRPRQHHMLQHPTCSVAPSSAPYRHPLHSDGLYNPNTTHARATQKHSNLSTAMYETQEKRNVCSFNAISMQPSRPDQSSETSLGDCSQS
jgi:hypothetical protein